MGTSKDGTVGAGDAGKAPSADGQPKNFAATAGETRSALRVRSIKGNVYSTVGHDAKGNPILEWRTDLPGGLPDDETLSYLKALDSDTLELADDPGVDERREGYNPYDKRPK